MRILLSGITVLSLFLVGCNEAKKSRGTANTRGVRSQNPPGSSGSTGGTAATLQALNCNEDAWGLIYDESNLRTPPSLSWQEGVRVFGAGSVNYEHVGEVSGSATSNTTGISFCGRVCRDPQNPNNEIYIGIWDSNFLSGQFDSEISVNIKVGGAYHGRVQSLNPTTFVDDFGSIEFIGGSSGSTGVASGQFCFTNTTLLGAAPASFKGQRICLGRWQIRADRFWRPSEC